MTISDAVVKFAKKVDGKLKYIRDRFGRGDNIEMDCTKKEFNDFCRQNSIDVSKLKKLIELISAKRKSQVFGVFFWS